MRRERADGEFSRNAIHFIYPWDHYLAAQGRYRSRGISKNCVKTMGRQLIQYVELALKARRGRKCAPTSRPTVGLAVLRSRYEWVNLIRQQKNPGNKTLVKIARK